MSEEPQCYDLKYRGGHVEYPKPSNCKFYLYENRVEIENPDLVIPYNAITGIENMDEKKISAKRVVALGAVFVPLAIVGAMWKTNHIYTVIQFRDQDGDKAIVLDFGDKVTDIQGWLYRTMLSCSRTISSTHSNNRSMVYENRKYGFSIRYPKSWIKDEIDHREQDYITLVEFRLSIEDKPPFVTLYLTELGSRYDSFESFFDHEKKEVQDDPKYSIIEISDVVVANKPSIKLVDVEYEGYKRMVTFVPENNKIFEISYSSKQEQFKEYLPVVNEIINSFQTIDSTPIPATANIATNTKEDPLLILKIRFARGEITEEQYKRMRSIVDDDSSEFSSLTLKIFWVGRYESGISDRSGSEFLNSLNREPYFIIILACNLILFLVFRTYSLIRVLRDSNLK